MTSSGGTGPGDPRGPVPPLAPDASIAPETRATAAIAGSVSAASALAPGLFLRLLGLPREELSPLAVLVLRLFAIRTAALAVLSARGNETARDLFLPVQGLDQLSWWELYRRGELPLRATSIAATVSAAIIALDLRRRLR